MMNSDDTSTASAAAGGKQQSPLDILEEILGDSKKAAEEKVSEKQAEVEADLAAQKAAADLARQQSEQQQIEQKLAELRQTTESPQHKARVEQIEEQKVQDQDHQEQMQGHHIIQLDHKKI